jgi:Zn2+/Cd2+-exporting ATPase
MGAAGSDVAIHSASVALMNNNLNRIPFLVELSRQTSRIIKQNLLIGGGFIVVFMVLAAAGEVTAIMAAFLHVVSSLLVVFNSARLVRSGEEIEQAEHELLVKTETRVRRRSVSEPAEVPVPVTV